MATLQPFLAAELAEQIYALQTSQDTRIISAKFKTDFDITPASRIEGNSGALMLIHKQTGFGMVAQGKGQFNNELLICMRGTASLYDALTDGHIGMTLSNCAQVVHAGFSHTFDSMVPELTRYISTLKKPPHTIHCVGHSLGGALATLTADWISHNKLAPNVKLYTFGSPRVGTPQFASQLTKKIGDDNIFRVNHLTDPVAMVPIWPFTHVPNPGSDYSIKLTGNIPTPSAHKMANYLSSTEGQNWLALRNNLNVVDESVVEKWLNSKDMVSFTSNTLNMISSAIAMIIKKILKVAGITIQAGLCAGFTIMDQLANLLEKAAAASKALAGYVGSLIKKVMQALGMVVNESVDLTAAFIRFVLSKLAFATNRIARTALEFVHGN